MTSVSAEVDKRNMYQQKKKIGFAISRSQACNIQVTEGTQQFSFFERFHASQPNVIRLKKNQIGASKGSLNTIITQTVHIT